MKSKRVSFIRGTRHYFSLALTLLLFACGSSDESGEIEQPEPSIAAPLPPVETEEKANNAPVISGKTDIAHIDTLFSFTPTLIDSDGDTIILTVESLPSWLTLIDHTLSGTPSIEDIGDHKLTLLASDNKDTSSIELVINVLNLPKTPESSDNIAPTISGAPANAALGQSFSFSPTATDENDDNLSFYSNNLPDWLTLDNATGKLAGKPLLSNVGLHKDIILHVTDGYLTASLVFNLTVVKDHTVPELTLTTSSARANELYNFTLTHNGKETSTITFSSNNLPHWLTLAHDTGVLSGTPSMEDVGDNTFSININDGTSNHDVEFTIAVEQSFLALALSTGNTLVIEDNTVLLSAALAEISQHKAHFNDIKSQLFKLDSASEKLTSIDWRPSHDAAIISPEYPFNDTVLYTTHAAKKADAIAVDSFAVAGSKALNSGRYLAFAGNPFRNIINEQMVKFLHNSFDWLSQKKHDQLTQFNVVLSQLDESHYFRDRSKTREWLDTNVANINYNDTGACDGTLLASCLTDKPDLLIISRFTRDTDDKAAIIKSVQTALNENIPVIYIQYDGGIGEHGRELLSLMNISHGGDNYWSDRYLSAFDPNTIMDALPSNIAKIKTLLTNFNNKKFNVDLTGCATRSCPDESNVQAEFFDGANAIKAMFNSFDAQKLDIFTSSDYRLHKLLILLADHYRQSVTYPMDKQTTDTVEFFQSLFADYAVYNTRSVNPTQKDMGNFSRSGFSHITAENAIVTLTSKPSFRSAGVYALPGQTFTITRTDNNTADTSVFINTLRTGATHIFNDNGYNRPYLLQTNRIAISPGERIEITSSYGGPIQIGFSQKDIDVSFEFENIGRHPHWRTPADDIVFAQKMAQADYDWAEIATEGFEVHSKLTKLSASLAGSIWPVASDFANATYQYTHNMVHVLAGFQGPGIDVVPEIHDFVTARGLSVDTIDIVKHMNADQPTCGWGCSGNPYDAGWNFSPAGHGDLHELGHGIERSSMRFEGYGGHSNTNFYSYFSKSVYEDDTDQSASCQSLPFESIFNTLQQSQLAADPSAYMQSNLTKSWSEHHAIYLQLMMAAQAEGTITNGWYLYPRLHIWDREMWRFDNSEDAWNTGKVALGFDDYTLTDFSAASQNDRLFISLSEITQLNLTDWFAMYGFTVSDKAKAQVLAKGHKLLDKIFYTSTGTGYCSSLNQNAIAVDGVQVWPMP